MNKNVIADHSAIKAATEFLSETCQISTALGGAKYVSIHDAAIACEKYSRIHVRTLIRLVDYVRRMRVAQVNHEKNARTELEHIVDLIISTVELPDDVPMFNGNPDFFIPTVGNPKK